MNCACGNPIPPHRLAINSTTCRANCRPKPVPGVYGSGINASTGTVGAIAELIVSADLMRRGFAVFRALSPACSCDLLVLCPDGRTLRVEVRSGQRGASGLLSYVKVDPAKSDVAAVYVHREDSIHYIPDLFSPAEVSSTA